MKINALVVLVAASAIPAAQAFSPGVRLRAYARHVPLRVARTPRSWGLGAISMQRAPPPRESEFNEGRGPYEMERQRIREREDIPYGPQYWEGLEQKGADWTRSGPDEGEVSGLDEAIDEEALPAPRWYIVQCNPGLEDNVKSTILAKMANSRRLQTTIKEVLVPCTMIMKSSVGGTVVQKQEKLLGGYVLIKMCMDKDTWYIIKNSNNVLNFVGHDRPRRNASGGIAAGRGHVVPTPLSRAEEKRIFDRISVMSNTQLENFEVVVYVHACVHTHTHACMHACMHAQTYANRCMGTYTHA